MLKKFNSISVFILTFSIFLSSVSFAVAAPEEGMFTPDQISKLPLKQKGLKIKPSEIYNPNGRRYCRRDYPHQYRRRLRYRRIRFAARFDFDQSSRRFRRARRWLRRRKKSTPKTVIKPTPKRTSCPPKITVC